MPDLSTNLTPDQRRREIAAIFAKGVLRLRSLGQTSPSPSFENSEKTLQIGLDVSATSSPDVTG